MNLRLQVQIATIKEGNKTIEQQGKEIERLNALVKDLDMRVSSCRHYLMGVQPDKIKVEYALISLGYDENGF